MVWNAADIHTGMEVLGLDGRPVGEVAHVWLDIDDGQGREFSALAHSASQGLMPLEDVAGAVRVRGGWFLVPSGESDLYIPFNAVQILFPGQNVTLACSSRECTELYCRRPGGIPVEGALKTMPATR